MYELITKEHNNMICFLYIDPTGVFLNSFDKDRELQLIYISYVSACARSGLRPNFVIIRFRDNRMRIVCLKKKLFLLIAISAYEAGIILSTEKSTNQREFT